MDLGVFNCVIMLVYGYLRLSFDRKLYMNLYWVASMVM